MADAIFQHGNPLYIDLIPESFIGDVTAGDVLDLHEGTPYVAHADIKEGEKGAVAVMGGVYKMPIDQTLASIPLSGQRVYWSMANKYLVRTVAPGNLHFGYFAWMPIEGIAPGQLANVVHNPDGTGGT